jgi:hypothetical protein
MINHSRGKHLFLIKYLINNRVKSACDGEALSPAQTPQVFRYKGPFLPKSSDTNSPSLPIGERGNSPSLPIAIPQVFRYQLPKSSDRGGGELPKSSDSLPAGRSGLLDGEIPFLPFRAPQVFRYPGPLSPVGLYETFPTNRPAC